MRRFLSDDSFDDWVLDFEHTAFRLELQREYREPDEEDIVKRFLAGEPKSPDEYPDFREWFDGVAERTAQGKQMTRVRVHEDPPTPYQQYLRWLDPWNTRAGERIRYMTRPRAYEVGLMPAAKDEDFWLVDSTRLIVMRFVEGRRVESELITDPVRVVRACAWRDVAVHHSTPLRRGDAAA